MKRYLKEYAEAWKEQRPAMEMVHLAILFVVVFLVLGFISTRGDLWKGWPILSLVAGLACLLRLLVVV